MKKETLEEVAERLFKKFQLENPIVPNSYIRPFKLGVIYGAKLQAEQDKNKYSEEDMREAFKSSSLTNMLNVYDSFEEFIEQFKKK
jgi:hypothetical protein